MGTYIETAATTVRLPWQLGRGALSLADAAARLCLHRGDRDPSELDILINAGLFKDLNIAEPAFASIIQEDIGANKGHPPRLDRHGTFSFDVLDGGCGALTAARMVDAFVGPGSAQLGMVVAADSDPSPGLTRGFRFTPAGGAMLLAHHPGDAGFVQFESRTFIEDVDLFEASVRFVPRAGLLRRGRNVLEIRESPAFAARCVAHAIDVATDFLGALGLRAADVDLLITSQYPPDFPENVARGLGIPNERLPRIPQSLWATHTAGLIAALESAITDGALARSRNTLFVTAGAGIAIGVALYRGEHSV